MMSRQDYVKFAKVLSDRREAALSIPEGAQRFAVRFTLAGLAHDMVEVFEADNPRFDRQRFLTAAGLSE